MAEIKKVSIVSPVYNGEGYIGRFLESVLEQTYPRIEQIIIDDGSADNTEGVVQSFRERFLQRGYTLIYRKQPENRGQAAAINVGLKLFTGEYMMWMDTDDIFYPGAIEKKVDFLEFHPEYDYVLNEGAVVLEENLNTTVRVLRRVQPAQKDYLFKDLIDEDNVVFCPGTIFVRAASLKKAIPDLTIYESREGQNWQLMLPLAYSCEYGYLKEVLFKYVVRGSSHSHQERMFWQEFSRRGNFYPLIANTIDKIVGMPPEEKEYWKEYTLQRTLRVQYMMCCENHKYRQSRKIEKEMRKHGFPIPRSERFWTMQTRYAARWLVQKTHTEALYRRLRGKENQDV